MTLTAARHVFDDRTRRRAHAWAAADGWLFLDALRGFASS
jgi:hypothetical protein